MPAHTGVLGNEAADVLAKAAVESNFVDEIPIPRNQVRDIVIKGVREIWDNEWNEYGEACMTKYFFPRHDKSKAKQAYSQSRLRLGRFVRIISGHNNLRYYQSKLDVSISPICRFCGEEPETFHHFVFECPALFHSRRRIFLDQLPDRDMNWSVKSLLEFSYLPHIHRLLDPNSVHDIHLVDTESEQESESDADDVDAN